MIRDALSLTVLASRPLTSRGLPRGSAVPPVSRPFASSDRYAASWILLSGIALLAGLIGPALAGAADGNRLAYLDAPADPYWVGRDAPRLTTPQWVGEEDVEAAIVLAVDDMADVERYEKFLRPILERLKQIDGRAPVSIMTKTIDASAPQLQTWLREGLSIEAHTDKHPCPCLQQGVFEPAKATYDRCIDSLAEIPNSRSVAFRMPCCDSMNSVSPRFFREVFNRTTPAGRYLTMDSSVFMLYTPRDPTLPRELVLDAQGGERFRKYLPYDRLMINYVEDYPYPYVIGGLCWEFPCVVPSDWEAQHRNGKCSPQTVADLKAAVDATVIKQGVFSLCFHPHGWIAAEQVVELIDHVVAKHGKRVKFLTFPEVQQRLDQNLLGGQPLRAADGSDNGVRVLDVDGDGYMDAVVGNASLRQTRLWQPRERRWLASGLPVQLVVQQPQGGSADAGVRWGVLRDRQPPAASLLVRSELAAGLWHFDGRGWVEDPNGLQGLELDSPLFTSRAGRDQGLRFRDLNGDGTAELIAGGPQGSAVFALAADGWQRLPFTLPAGLAIVDANGGDAGLRFTDLDSDDRLDVVFSDARRFAACLFQSQQAGWAGRLFDAPRTGEETELPMIVRGDGSDNGAWFSYGHMWVQNEDTGARLPDHVQQRSFADFLAPAKSPSPPSVLRSGE